MLLMFFPVFQIKPSHMDLVIISKSLFLGGAEGGLHFIKAIEKAEGFDNIHSCNKKHNLIKIKNCDM